MTVLKKFAYAFRSMSLRQHLIYWIIPLVFISLLALSYFAGPRWLQNIIAPSINRELGLFETLEHLTILLIVVLAVLCLIKEKKPFLKFVFFLCVIVFVFLFFEEIDWGDHYINYINGISLEERTVLHNFHNQVGSSSRINKMMQLCYFIIAISFVILPYVRKEKLPVWLQQLTPSIRLQFAVIVLPLIGQFPLWLNKLNQISINNPLYDNLAEFEEMGIYYIFLLYFVEMYKKLRSRDRQPGDTYYYNVQFTRQYSKQN